jgi:hypothetical protein
LIFKEVERHGGYGVAKKRKKEIEQKTNRRVFVFKDLSNDPFTSFRTDQYIVAIEEHKDD